MPQFESTGNDLHWAAMNGSLDSVLACLKRGDNVNERMTLGWTAIHLATQVNSVPCIHALAEHGADLDAQNDSGTTALHVAVASDFLESALALIENGASLEIKNMHDNTPLRSSVHHGTLLRHALIAHGARQDELRPKSDEREIWALADVPMLHAAARSGLTKRALQLMREGHDPDLQHSGQTALEEAIAAGFKETAAAMQAFKASTAIERVLRPHMSGPIIPNHADQVAQRASSRMQR